MADKTSIEWTRGADGSPGATWNPITGCSVVSPGCTNCYAMRLAGTRLQHHPSRAGLTRDSKAGPVWTGEVRFNEQWLDQPLRWKRSRRIFVCAHSDLFHENVPDAWVDRVFAVMALAPQHTFQVLTKRADRMRQYFADRTSGDPWAEASDYVADLLGTKYSPAVLEPEDMPLPNVWLGVSAEDQQRADERIPHLLATPAAVRWVSAEPLLGPIDMRLGENVHHHPDNDQSHPAVGVIVHAARKALGVPTIDWIVAGGESGANARPMHPDWARSLRDQCKAARVPFFMKQMSGERKSAMPPIPEDLLIREAPRAAS